MYLLVSLLSLVMAIIFSRFCAYLSDFGERFGPFVVALVCWVNFFIFACFWLDENTCEGKPYKNNKNDEEHLTKNNEEHLNVEIFENDGMIKIDTHSYRATPQETSYISFDDSFNSNRIICPACGSEYVRKLSAFEQGLTAGMMAGMCGLPGAATAPTWQCTRCGKQFRA